MGETTPEHETTQYVVNQYERQGSDIEAVQHHVDTWGPFDSEREAFLWSEAFLDEVSREKVPAAGRHVFQVVPLTSPATIASLVARLNH
jgi:hypothetical protein